MGVLAKHPNGSLVLYVKGAPEVVKGLVEPSSLPSDFEGELAKYTRDGLRVLGLASRWEIERAKIHSFFSMN